MAELVPISSSVAASIGQRACELIQQLAEPVVVLEAGQAPGAITDSYVGGHPFLAPGSDWPVGASGKELVFVLQINFAQVPAHLSDFPREGMLQWFVDGADITLGITWDEETRGRAGLYLRWLTVEELTQGSNSKPSDELPYAVSENQDEEDWRPSPLVTTDPQAVMFTSDRRVPAPCELSEGINLTKAEEELFELIEDEDLEPVHMPEDSIGGRPCFSQMDPRTHYENSANSKTLILQLGSLGEKLLWGDCGSAQIFGDSKALAEGDLSSLWWDWAY